MGRDERLLMQRILDGAAKRLERTSADWAQAAQRVRDLGDDRDFWNEIFPR